MFEYLFLSSIEERDESFTTDDGKINKFGSALAFKSAVAIA